jgi:hypothetical protein
VAVGVRLPARCDPCGCRLSAEARNNSPEYLAQVTDCSAAGGEPPDYVMDHAMLVSWPETSVPAERRC